MIADAIAYEDMVRSVLTDIIDVTDDSPESNRAQRRQDVWGTVALTNLQGELINRSVTGGVVITTTIYQRQSLPWDTAEQVVEAMVGLQNSVTVNLEPVTLANFRGIAISVGYAV